MYGMIGRSETLSDESALTVILSPSVGTWICYTAWSTLKKTGLERKRACRSGEALAAERNPGRNTRHESGQSIILTMPVRARATRACLKMPLSSRDLRRLPMPLIAALNKPFGTICQFSAHETRASLGDWVKTPGVCPAGRLDADSEGLLLLTDDGALQGAHRGTASQARQALLGASRRRARRSDAQTAPEERGPRRLATM